MTRKGLPPARRRITINDRTADGVADRVMYAARRAVKSCERIRCNETEVVDCDDFSCFVDKLHSRGSFVVDVMDKGWEK